MTHSSVHMFCVGLIYQNRTTNWHWLDQSTVYVLTGKANQMRCNEWQNCGHPMYCWYETLLSVAVARMLLSLCLSISLRPRRLSLSRCVGRHESCMRKWLLSIRCIELSSFLDRFHLSIMRREYVVSSNKANDKIAVTRLWWFAFICVSENMNGNAHTHNVDGLYRLHPTDFTGFLLSLRAWRASHSTTQF